MENLTIVASRTLTQTSRSAGLSPPCGDPGGYPDSTETVRSQYRNPSTTLGYGNSPIIMSTASWARVGEGSPGMDAVKRVLDTTPEPGGLQQQTATGAEPETGFFGQRARRTIAGPADSAAGVSTKEPSHGGGASDSKDFLSS